MHDFATVGAVMSGVLEGRQRSTRTRTDRGLHHDLPRSFQEVCLGRPSVVAASLLAPTDERPQGGFTDEAREVREAQWARASLQIDVKLDLPVGPGASLQTGRACSLWSAGTRHRSAVCRGVHLIMGATADRMSST